MVSFVFQVAATEHVSFVFQVATTEHVQNVLSTFNLKILQFCLFLVFFPCKCLPHMVTKINNESASHLRSSHLTKKRSSLKNSKCYGRDIIQFWHECAILSRPGLRDRGMDVSETIVFQAVPYSRGRAQEKESIKRASI